MSLDLESGQVLRKSESNVLSRRVAKGVCDLVEW